MQRFSSVVGRTLPGLLPGLLLPGAVLLGSAPAASAQSFVNTPSQIPANGGFTENVDFADVDGDGDMDCALAEGGDGGNDQNNLWINRGFEAGGTIGFFVDRTAAQFPAVLDDSRDLDFADIDGDGDFDIYISNTSLASNQSNRWWVNMGGAQGGTQGFFQDQTPTRWTFIAVNDGVNHFSSVGNGVALPGGGFIDWSCDCVFGDLDNDGDLDIVHTTYGGNFDGGAPSRLFLNSGAGQFEEFNPSGVQLTGSAIPNNTPALWVLGVQSNGTTNTTGLQADIADTPLGVEIGDLDGDHDIDILQGARNQIPRVYRSRLTDTGVMAAYQDVTYLTGVPASTDTGGNYEQELGDFENDNDLDIYGLNWPGFDDVTIKNNGAGVFSGLFTLAGSGADDNEGDFFDYNNDGRLDIYVTNFSGQDKLYRNDGPPNWNFTNVTNQLPSLGGTGLGSDSCDVDADGDYDFLVGNDGGQAEWFLKNVTNIPDAIAPRVANLEQAPNRVVGAAPTVVRVHVYDNASWDVTRYDVATLEYSVNNFSTFSSAPMHISGGQLFRGEIPGATSGTVSYRARVVDEHGNVGLSTVKSFSTTGGGAVNYCTTSTTTNGCNPLMAATGTASIGAASGFTLSCSNIEGQRAGLVFYGVSGRASSAWAPGNTSTLCVKAPVQRLSTQNSGGTSGACDGSMSEDWLAFQASHPGALGQPFSAGATVDAQCWFRDPAAPGTTNLSDGIEFVTVP
jgi:hypothetical protein